MTLALAFVVISVSPRYPNSGFVKLFYMHPISERFKVVVNQSRLIMLPLVTDRHKTHQNDCLDE